MEQMELKDFIEMPKEDGVYSQPWVIKDDARVEDVKVKKNKKGAGRPIKRIPYAELREAYLYNEVAECCKILKCSVATLYKNIHYYDEHPEMCN